MNTRPPTEAQLTSIVDKAEELIRAPGGKVITTMCGFPSRAAIEAHRALIAGQLKLDPSLVEVWIPQGEDEVYGEAQPFSGSYHGDHTSEHLSGAVPSLVPLTNPRLAPKPILSDSDFE